MDPLITSALIGGVANLGGGMLSSAGQASANAQNVEMQRTYNQQMLNAQQAQHEQNTAFAEDQQAFNAYQQSQQNIFNMEEAGKARNFASSEATMARDVQNQFQERMANTQYQRAMADMRAAGLNPILAYKMGGNASPAGGGQQASAASASGSAASSGMASSAGPPGLRAPTVQNSELEVGRALGNMVNSATELLKTFTNIKQTEATTANVEIDTDKKKAELQKINAETVRTAAETNKTHAETANILAQNRALVAQGYTAEEISKMTALERQNLERFGRREAPTAPDQLLRDLKNAFESRGVTIGNIEKIINDIAPPAGKAIMDTNKSLGTGIGNWLRRNF